MPSALPSALVSTLPWALQLSNLSKTFGGQKALDNAGLAVRQGEVHGLLGQNGSGKSTMIKVLAGFYAPDPGSRLAVCGTEVPLPLAPGARRLPASPYELRPPASRPRAEPHRAGEPHGGPPRPAPPLGH